MSDQVPYGPPRENGSGGERRLTVPILTRVEGEGGLLVRLDGEEIRDVQLRIYEPPRLFEAFLRGRSFDEVADITARICGICPVAYQMTAVQAIENAMEIRVTPEIDLLRQLLYCGEWIESHVLHMHLLHAPDFFGCQSGIELARRFPDEVKRGLQMKKFGNRLLEILGGRAIHPINVAVGGFYGVPRREDLHSLIPDFRWCLQAAIDTAKWVADFPFPDFQADYQYVSLSDSERYPIMHGEIACSDGTRLPAQEYENVFFEEQVPHSTALHSYRVKDRQSYFVGPLARVNLNLEKLSPKARHAADEIGWQTPCLNPYRSIVARALEVVHAFDLALSILEQYVPPKEVRVRFATGAGEGSAATEAPRGLLYHRYRIDSDGRIEYAKIVPPTSQNQAQIEADLRRLLPSILAEEDEAVALKCEQLVRSYDPCISCSTHFLKLRIEGRSGSSPSSL
ncbi:MAG: Ni/Fe hydrogenase subunit alpha [Aureliella sp.]